MNPIYCAMCDKDMKAKAINTKGYFCSDCMRLVNQSTIRSLNKKEKIDFDLSDRFKKAG